MKVFVISGLSSSNEYIVASGEAGPLIDGEYRRVDDAGPYHVGFMLALTDENIGLFNQARADLKTIADMKHEIIAKFSKLTNPKD